MVLSDRSHDHLVDTVFGDNVGADFGVGALDLMGERFSDVVEEPSDFADLHVRAQFTSQESGQ